MQTNDTIDGTGARRRVRNAGGLAALAAATVLMLAACTGSGAAAGAGGSAAPAGGATAAPAAATASSDSRTGAYGGYGGAEATEAPAASAAEGGEAYEVGTGTDASAGPYLTGENGMTLYTFTKDSPGASVCDGQCATNWPPFTLGSGETVKAGAGVTGTFATITRSDGTAQVTYNDKPLYYFAADKKAGDVVGQGVGGVWYVAAP